MAQAGESYLVAITSDTVKAKNRFFCKLFDDMIIPSLCRLRRKELSGYDDFSCTGCRKLRIMNAESALLAEPI